MAASSGSGGASSEPPAHVAPELAGERLRRRVAGTGDGEDVPALPAGDLAEDVRRGAEAVEPEARGVAAHPQGPEADQAGAQQRGGLRSG